MFIVPRFVVAALAVSLVFSPANAATSSIGVVTDASRASIASAPATIGSAVYDGDSFSTDRAGLLRVRLGAAQVYLSAESNLRLSASRSGTLAQLLGGTLAFSSAKAAAIDVQILQARVRPVADVATIAKITLIGPKEILVAAKKGSLEFSYGGERQIIPEGNTYRFELDPGRESSNVVAEPAPSGQHRAVKTAATGRKFVYVIVAAVAIATYFALDETYESPHKP